MNPKRKVSDLDIVQMNNVGLSLAYIGSRLGVHHTTVTYRLKSLGMQPVDTRRAFMEDIFESLTPTQQTWLMDQLGPGLSIKELVRSLLIKEFVNQRSQAFAKVS